MEDAYWRTLRDHLAASFEVEDLPTGGLGLARDGAQVTLVPYTTFGAPWLELTAVLARRVRAPPTPALRRNFDLAIGNLGVRHGQLVLRQLLPRDGLEVASLVETIEALAASVREADGPRG